MATVIDASVMVAFLLRDDRYGDSARRILEQLDKDHLIVRGSSGMRFAMS